LNKRARMRLIGVTSVLLIAIVGFAIYFGNRSDQGAVYANVSNIAKDNSFVGKRVRVGGSVVPGSWNKQSNPMRFTIREESDKTGTGPTLKVVYTGTVPNTFGDGVVAIVTGTLDKNGTVAATEMITKCPSKYESAQGAIPVAEIGLGKSLVGQKDLKTTGYVKPGSIQDATSAQRFVLAEKADGTGATLTVIYGGALPSGMKDGAQVVITGTLATGGKFTATGVALEQGQK
jgi:cytochrome c-type biogenesis protein CcmE